MKACVSDPTEKMIRDRRVRLTVEIPCVTANARYNEGSKGGRNQTTQRDTLVILAVFDGGEVDSNG